MSRIAEMDILRKLRFYKKKNQNFTKIFCPYSNVTYFIINKPEKMKKKTLKTFFARVVLISSLCTSLWNIFAFFFHKLFPLACLGLFSDVLNSKSPQSTTRLISLDGYTVVYEFCCNTIDSI